MPKNPHSTFHIPHSTKGIVYLVGAGPGDPKLITVRGLEVLRQADVVIYDHLVSERLLEQCRRGARLIYAGKEQGHHAKSQAMINRLMIRHAKAGKTVVRLKGGDPVVFGRGGEEALALAQAGLAYEIVPGVTSAIAVPAYAGIPVTHRELSSSVAIVTGHETPSKSEASVRWDAVATATDTLVVLMGLGRLAQTVQALLRAGRSPATPCAVISQGTLPEQAVVVGRLETILERCRAAGLRSPAIAVVGEVVRLRESLRWCEHRPLFGLRVVVTRPAERAESLSASLETLGADVITLPAIELQPLKPNGVFTRAIRQIDEFDWVFFTSPEGINAFQRLLSRRRKDLRLLRGRHIAAIGPKTAQAIRERGIHVDLVPETYSQEGLLRGAALRRLSGKRALILNAQDSRDVLERGLKDLNVDVTRVPLYRAVASKHLARRIRGIFQQPVDLVTVTSASCASHLAEALRAAGLADRLTSLRVASIGPISSAAVRQLGGHVAVEARISTIEGLVEAIVSFVATQPRAARDGLRQRGGIQRAIPGASAT